MGKVKRELPEILPFFIKILLLVKIYESVKLRDNKIYVIVFYKNTQKAKAADKSLKCDFFRLNVKSFSTSKLVLSKKKLFVTSNVCDSQL